MTDQEVIDLNLQTPNGVFTPEFTYDDYFFNEETEKYEYTNLVITKTAQQVYDEWLEAINNPSTQEPTQEEKLQNELLTLTEQNVDLDFRVLMLEMASI